MQIVEIDVIGLEALQTVVNRPEDRLFGETTFIGILPHFSTHLRRKNQLVTFAANGLSEHAFCHARLVNVRCVKKVDSLFDTAVNHPRGSWLVSRFAECHCAETEPGNIQIGVLEFSIVHSSSHLFNQEELIKGNQGNQLFRWHSLFRGSRHRISSSLQNRFCTDPETRRIVRAEKYIDAGFYPQFEIRGLGAYGHDLAVLLGGFDREL